MAAFNKVILMGNLTLEPEIRYTPNVIAVCDLNIAINTPKGKGEGKKEDTVFVDVTVWDKQAENCKEYLSKGRPVMVEGRLKMDTWEDKQTGKKRSKLGVVAQSVQFIGWGEVKKNEPDTQINEEQELDIEDEDNGSDIPF